MYLGNTDVVFAQMSKVHSHYDSFACCQLLSIELFHDRATLFLVSQRLKSPHLTCLVLHISLGRYLCTGVSSLFAIFIQNVWRMHHCNLQRNFNWMYGLVLVLSAELCGGIKCLLNKAVTLHKTVILPQIMLAHVCVYHALWAKIARSVKFPVPMFHSIGHDNGSVSWLII